MTGKRKPIMHDSESCKGIGTYDICYDEDNTPWLQCSNCGAVIDDWIRWKNSYSSFWQDPARWNIKKDHLVCLLGYFAEQYKKHYNIPFTFSLNERGLFRGVEIFCIRKVYAMLGNDVYMARGYIDWIFSTKVEKRKRKITSLSFLTVPELINEYKLCHAKNKKITRDRRLPVKMLDWINENTPSILNIVSLRDFGELRMALIAYRNGHLDANNDFTLFIERLRANNVIDDNMNIVGWSE